MRIGNLVAVAGLAAFVAGCGSDSSCKDESPPLNPDSPLSVCSNTVAPGQTVTVQVKACPRCDQSSPTCLVHAETATQGLVTIEPNAQVCDADASCPVGGNCSLAPLSCSFTVPANQPNGNLTVNVVGGDRSETLLLTVDSGALACTG